jgi:predicted transcriptional regulator
VPETRYSVRLSTELLTKLQVMAKARDTTAADILRCLIQHATDAQLRACPHDPPHRYPFGCPD